MDIGRPIGRAVVLGLIALSVGPVFAAPVHRRVEPRLVAAGLVPASLAVDPSPGEASDGNGILEPGETVAVEPSWKNNATDATLEGTADGPYGPAGADYVMADSQSSYGTISSGATGSCDAAADCYAISVSKPASRPATHWDISFGETLSTGDATTWTMHVGDSFADVPRSNPFYKKIEALLHSGMTSGCGASTFCPTKDLTHSDIFIFLAKAMAGGGSNIPIAGSVQTLDYLCAAGGNSLFLDVAPTDPYCKHAHYLWSRGIINPGSPPAYLLPSQRVERLEMAIWMSRALLWSQLPAGSVLTLPGSYGPDPVTSRSYDCDPSSPSTHFTDAGPETGGICRAAHYVWARGIVAGCSGTKFCVNDFLTRDQMAKFLMNAFPAALNGP